MTLTHGETEPCYQRLGFLVCRGRPAAHNSRRRIHPH
jgi:hypothetical protein